MDNAVKTLRRPAVSGSIKRYLVAGYLVTATSYVEACNKLQEALLQGKVLLNKKEAING